MEWIRRFLNGELYDAWRYLGAAKEECGTRFRVWAPNAEAVTVVCGKEFPMLRTEGGIWEAFAETEENMYHYVVTGRDAAPRKKCDPFALAAYPGSPENSMVYDISGYEWSDSEYLKYRKEHLLHESPLNIYEVHPGSWKEAGKRYPELAEELIPYVKEMGFTHIELMPVCEYPFDDSWGYQTTGYFAPTARHGTPTEFMEFVDICHREGIGVIMDWVPAHFPKDDWSLCEFDGTFLYEPEDELLREHPHWGTRVFDYGKGAVRSFLISSALFFVEQYHIDGLRVDAVASMLYLDYGRENGRWRRNRFGGNQNLDAIGFLRDLNRAVLTKYPEVMMIAEESTAWPMVTRPDYVGGLGFNLKWNMGWVNDMLQYMATDPFYRRYVHRNITFSLMYAFSENFLLPISHDEVVHMKGSLFGKMPGNNEENVKVFYSYMMAHPGKKLMFMGTELGQREEWDFRKPLSWESENTELKRFFAELNRFYLGTPALYQLDFEERGFEWISSDDYQGNTVAFIRRGKEDELVCVFNFSGIPHERYRIGMPEAGEYEVVFSCGGETGRVYCTDNIHWHDRSVSCELYLPRLSGIYLKKMRSEI